MTQWDGMGGWSPPRKDMRGDCMTKPKITGYRDLSEAEIALINRVKAKAKEVGELLDEIQPHAATDLRWISIGRTDLQQGFMAVIRAIARPEGF
jgi:hypothetical protein